MTDTTQTLFATITYTPDGKLQVLIDKEGIKPLDGHKLVQALDGSIETLRQIKADVIAAATPPAAEHFERMASTTH